MAKFSSRLALKTGRQRLPIAELEKLVGQAKKVSAHANAEVARLQSLLDDEKHAHRMSLGDQAVLRRLVQLPEKTWGGLSVRLAKMFPGGLDYEHLTYWLDHRPTPGAEPQHSEEKLEDSSRQEPKPHPENLAGESSQTSPPDDEETGKDSSATDSHTPDKNAGEVGGGSVENAGN